MTAEQLIHHTFPWEIAPGVPADGFDAVDDDDVALPPAA